MAEEVITQVQTEQVQQAPVTDTPATEPVAQTPPVGEVFTPPVEETPLASETLDEGVTYEYTATGDAGLDVALAFVGNLGFAGNDPAMVAAAKGDFSLLEAKLAALGDAAKGWERMVALAKDAHSRSATAAAEAQAKSEQAILAIAGGAESWAEIRQWAADNADPAEKAEINKLIDGGPVAARAAAALLTMTYRNATGTTITPRDPAPYAGANPTLSGNSRLSPKEYGTAVRELHARLGSKMEGSAEYKALQQRLAR